MNPLKTILIAFSPPPFALEAIRRNHPRAEIRIAPPLDADERFPAALLQGVDAALLEIFPANFADFDRLRLLQLASVGFEQLENVPAFERGVRACNARGVFDVAIAEWNLLMMLLWQRHLPEMMANQRNAVWDRSSRFQHELRGAVVGFYGYGGIARETARQAKALGLTVWALTRDGQVRPRTDTYNLAGIGDPEGRLPDRAFAADEREAFFSGLDYLVLTLPLTPASKGAISEADLRQLKPSAVLINPARAGLVEESVLIRALREKWIRGAAFDVHYAYPLPPDHPLWRMPEIVLTPHISGSGGTPSFPARLYEIFAENLLRFEAGRPLLNEVTARDVRGR